MKAFGVNFEGAGMKNRLSRLTKEDLIIWGFWGLVTLFFLLLAVAALFSYQVLVKTEILPEPTVKTPAVSSVRLDEAIRLLDERQVKFNEALGR